MNRYYDTRPGSWKEAISGEMQMGETRDCVEDARAGACSACMVLTGPAPLHTNSTRQLRAGKRPLGIDAFRQVVPRIGVATNCNICRVNAR